jgi:glycosyltransferase involved in cell wall biosynthesis
MSEITPVTAVTPLFQGERFVGEALNSLFADSSISKVIVVDDGSTDAGPSIVREKYPEAQLVLQSNSGVSKARNTGLSASETEFVIFLDQDDQLVSGALDIMLRAAHEEKADFVYGDYFQVDEDGNNQQLIRQPDISGDPASMSLETCCSASVCCLFRRSTLLSIGGFDETMMGCEDWDVYTRLALSGAKFAHVPQPIFKFRYHPSSASKNFWLMWKCFRQFEIKHLKSTLALPDGPRLNVRRRDRFLNDNLRFAYGVHDVDGSWLFRRVNRTVHFGRILMKDPGLAMELIRRAFARLKA